MKKITDTELIRSSNRREIIQTLRRHGQLARVEIGKYTQLSPATITSITSELIQQGLMVEQQSELNAETGRGRPKVKLQLNPHAVYYLAIKLSINEVELILADLNGNMLYQQTRSVLTVSLNQTQLLDVLCQSFNAFLDKNAIDRAKLRGLGIAIQGVTDQQGKGILWSPAINGQQLEIVEQLKQQLHLPVFISNDANCIAVALKQLPQYQAVNSLVAIQLGYGVGMGLWLDDQLYQGEAASNTEFGHTKFSLNGPQCRCGGRGCIEAYVGDYAIYRDASAIYNLPQADMLHPSEKQMRELNLLAEHPNSPMQQIFTQAGTVLGLGLANVMALFNPQKIVISGPGVRAYRYMETAMRNTLTENLLPYHQQQDVVEVYNWDEDLTGLGIIAIVQQHTD